MCVWPNSRESIPMFHVYLPGCKKTSPMTDRLLTHSHPPHTHTHTHQTHPHTHHTHTHSHPPHTHTLTPTTHTLTPTTTHLIRTKTRRKRQHSRTYLTPFDLVKRITLPKSTSFFKQNSTYVIRKRKDKNCSKTSHLVFVIAMHLSKRAQDKKKQFNTLYACGDPECTSTYSIMYY